MRALSALAFAAILAAAAPARAEMVNVEARGLCHRYDEIARQLGNRYKEAPVSLGVQTNGNLLQVFASQDNGTWTILSTSPSGTTCVVAAGKSWESLKIKAEPEA